MAGLTEPIPAATRRLLRAAVLELRRREPRRLRFPGRLSVGVPGGVAYSCATDSPPGLDLGLRTDLVAALLDRLVRARSSDDDAPVVVWLSRAGDLTPEDVDAAWLTAALAAGAELDLDPILVVVTRRGWRDPRSGASRSWRRLRDRTTPLTQ